MVATVVASVIIGGCIIGGASMVMSQQTQIAAQQAKVHATESDADWLNDYIAKQEAERRQEEIIYELRRMNLGRD